MAIAVTSCFVEVDRGASSAQPISTQFAANYTQTYPFKDLPGVVSSSVASGAYVSSESSESIMVKFWELSKLSVTGSHSKLRLSFFVV